MRSRFSRSRAISVPAARRSVVESAGVETTVRLTLTAALSETTDERMSKTTAHPTIVVRVTTNEVTTEVTGEPNPEVETPGGDD
jgi:hypothetical protein